jgi:hypothetical protein
MKQYKIKKVGNSFTTLLARRISQVIVLVELEPQS